MQNRQPSVLSLMQLGALMRGKTRSTSESHVYTTIVDQGGSTIRVDGRLEASGDCGSNPLHGISIGADAHAQFGTGGRVDEVVVLAGALPESTCAVLEEALRRRI